MIIGINARTFSIAEPDGEVQSAIKLVSTLIEISEHKHEFVLFGYKNIKNISKFSMCNLKSTGFVFNSQIWGLIWEQFLPIFVKLNKIDILFSPTSNGPMFYNKKLFNAKNIVWIHDVNQFYEWGGSTIYRYASRVRYPNMVNSADVIITVSKFSKKEIANVLHVPEYKIKVVYNGIDDLFLSNKKPKKILNLPDNYILYVGTTHPRKNLTRLVSAYNKIKDKIDEHLVLIGPTRRKIFAEMPREMFRDNNKIVIKSFVSSEQLKYAYQNASLLVYPSIYEGFGLPPLEALACGTPVVVSRIPVLLEVLRGHAHYVDPYNVDDIARGILTVLEDTTYRRRMVSKGKKHAKQFTWVKSARDVLNLIENLY